MMHGPINIRFTEVCGCFKKTKQFGITKLAIITKKNDLSINQLNYKVPEKTHAAEGLVSSIP